MTIRAVSVDEYRAMVRDAWTEEEFQRETVSLANQHGWKVASFRKARTKHGWVTPAGAQGKGWLDLFLCHEERGLVLARELKVPPNKLTPEQRDWLRVLTACGIDAGVWTPADWDTIVRTLTA